MRFWHWASWTLVVLCGVALLLSAPLGKQYEIPWWVQASFATLTVLALLSASLTKHLDCPACNAYAGNGYRGDAISSKPLYARADGEADRRYKYNPTVTTYRLKARCTKCGHVWDRGLSTTTAA